MSDKVMVDRTVLELTAEVLEFASMILPGAASAQTAQALRHIQQALDAPAPAASSGAEAGVHRGHGDWQDAHDELLRQTADVRREWETMKAALVSIRDGSRLSREWFKSRLGQRKYPTWYAVNPLQDNTLAAYHTAREALIGISPEPAAPAPAGAE